MSERFLMLAEEIVNNWPKSGETDGSWFFKHRQAVGLDLESVFQPIVKVSNDELTVILHDEDSSATEVIPVSLDPNSLDMGMLSNDKTRKVEKTLRGLYDAELRIREGILL